MKKQFCSYEISLALKEIKFNEPCMAIYDEKGHLYFLTDNYLGGINRKRNSSLCFNDDGEYDDNITECTAPLWQEVIDWFREEYNIHIWIYYCFVLESSFYQIRHEISTDEYSHFTNDTDSNKMHEFTFYESREQAILKAIELIKTR